MEALLYFALWAGAIFLMMRVGCGAYVMGLGRYLNHSEFDTLRAHSGMRRWQPPSRAKDSVCHKRVVPETAKTSVFEGEVYFFCSRECREIFEALPEVYVNGQSSVPPSPEPGQASERPHA